MVKTLALLTDNPKIPERQTDFVITVNNEPVSASKGYVVYPGEIMTKPSLPIKPTAMKIELNENEK